MGLFSSFLNPFGGGGGDSGGGSSSYGGGFNKSSSSSSDSNSNNVTTTTDNSVTTNTDARSYATTTTNNSLSSWLDQSVSEWVDASQRTAIDVKDSRSYDNSQRTAIDVQDSSSRDNSVRAWNDASTTNTTTNTTVQNADAAQVVGINAALLQSISANQSETQRAIAKMGADGIAAQADAARSMFATASADAGKAWGLTLDKTSEALDKLLINTRATVGDTLSTANTVAGRAIQSNPDASAGANVKIALIGAAAVMLAALISRRA